MVIPISVDNQDGATPGDYSGVPASVSFSATETSKTFRFTATQDTVDDDDESVRLSFDLRTVDRVFAGDTTETIVKIIDDDDPEVTVSFGQSSYSVEEGSDVVVTVELSADPERTVVMPISRTPKDGASPGDYSGVPASVSFSATETSKTFRFAATQDTLDDDDESVELSFGAMPDERVSEGTPNTTQVSIIDDDDPEVTVTFEQSSYTVGEGSTVTVTVTLDADPERTVEIPINVDNQGGASPGDYSGVPASVSFSATETSKTFRFTATQDTVDDDDERVELSFGALPERVSEGATTETVVAIIDDDDPEVTVSFGQPSYSVDEADTVTVTVTLDADPERTVVIPINVDNQNGATPGDYSGVPASVSFSATETSKTFSFAATHDTLDDDDESVELSFGAMPDERVSEGTPSTTTVEIIDDDDPEVTVSFGPSYTVGEGGAVTVTVTLDADPERTVVIPINVDNQNGATPGDYSGVPASVSFSATETSKTFSFAATHDTLDDDDESVELSFGVLPERVSEGTPNATTVEIIDDDDPEVTVSFGESSYTVGEGGAVTVTVELDADPERTVVIPISVDNQDGATGGDYSGVPASVSFSATETSKTFSFAATQDTVDDDDESVRLSFDLRTVDRVFAGDTTETIVKIIDDDDPEVTVSFGQSSYSVEEGSDVVVTVELSADPERTVVIPISRTPKDGASPGDYSGVPASVTFSATETRKTFSFTATQDTVDDDDESVRLSFGALPERVFAGTPSTTTVEIEDDDDPDVAVSFGAMSYSATEGDSVTVTVELDADPERTVVIPINVDNQNGATGSDYSGVPASVSFSATETSKTFSFAATQDTVDDDDESVELSFGALPERVSAGTPSATTVEIIDDDDPEVTVTFEQSSYTVGEGSTVTVRVELDADPERTVVIPISVDNQDGATGGDYSGVPASVSFSATETSKTFRFAATQDTVDDDDESVRLSFGALPERVFAGDTTETIVKIIDDDDPEVTVSFGQSSYSVEEGSDVVVTVELSADPERTVVIPISRTPKDGASPGDYSGVPASVTFSATETSKTFRFAATQDTVDDDDERVELSFGALPERVSEGTPSATTVEIEDDDDPEVTVSFGESSYTVGEGSTVTVRVELDADPERTVVIPISRTLKDGATGSDYSAPASVTFHATETSNTINFSATQDTVDDDDERVELSFGALPERVLRGTPSATEVEIIDDDDPEVTVRFAKLDYEVGEGSSVTVTVELDADPERTVEIPITRTHQNGATGSDYSGVPASVTFNATETRKTFSFAATQDTEDDDDERVELGFGALPDRVVAGMPSATTVEIEDDDDPEVRVSFEQSSYTVGEGGAVTVTVTLDADPERTVVIPISVDNQDGATGGDYSGVPASVSFSATETRKTISFAATQDTVDDDDERVELSFGALPERVFAGTPSATTVEIEDDDDPEVTVSFGESSYTVGEGGAVTVTVELDADPERTVVIPISVDNQDGATGGDYSGVPASVSFSATETRKTISFAATDDTEDDDDESVELSFGAMPDERVSEGTPSTTTVEIEDDDDPEVRVSFEQSSYTVGEGSTVTVTVTLDADPERTVVIPISRTPKDGATGSDYSGVPASVTFNATETRKTFSFAATQDTEDDDDERVELSFGALPERVVAGMPSTTTVEIEDDDDPEVRVSFGESSYTVGEGGAVTVTVELDADPERTVVIPISVDNQDGATGGDYSGVPASVSFSATETRKTISFAATDDTEDDDDESVELSFGAMPDERVSEGTPSTTTVEIEDDDDPEVRVSFGEPRYEVGEDDTVTVTVTLDADPERTVEIPITRTHQNGASPGDYSAPAIVTFDATETSQEFTFTATHDTEDDDDESVALGFDWARLQQTDERVLAGATTETIVAIIDDDDPEVTVTFEQSSYMVGEGGAVTVTVTLDADPERTVVIPISVDNQDGATGGDYSGVPASVSFSATETSKTFSFAATQDTVDDDDERVELSFGVLPERVFAGTPNATTVEIIDDDDPEVTVTFEQSSYTVGEGSTVTVTVTLDADPERTVVIPINVDNQGGATGSDYSTPASVTFNATETTKTISFSAVDDTLDDDDESVRLSFDLRTVDRVFAGDTTETIVKIIDDDDPEVTVSFGQSSYSVEEGSDVVVTVELSADPERTVMIPITRSDQGGASSGDYLGVPPSITFNATETRKTFSFGAIDDKVDDDNESVELGFGQPPDRVTAAAPTITRVSLTDNDDRGVTVTPTSLGIDEGSDDAYQVVLDSEPLGGNVIVTVVAPDNLDLSVNQTSLTFTSANWDTAQEVRVSAGQDSDDIDDQDTITHTVSGADYASETANSVSVKVIDDEDPQVRVSYGLPSYTVREGSEISITVTLSKDPERTVVIPISRTPQDGASSGDYSAPASVTFNATETSKTITFRALDDTLDDDGESVKLSFGSSLPPSVAVGSTPTTTVAIGDDDDPEVRVSFAQSRYSVAEGGDVTVTVELDADPERTVEIPITRTHQNGATGRDYSGVPASVTFNATETRKTFSFAATEDTLDDDDERVELSFGALPERVFAGTPNATTLEIDDDDDPEVTVSFALSSYRVGEGSSVTVTVELDADPERTVEIPITRTHQNGATGSDYSGVPASVTFNATETRKTFSFAATEDTLDDDDESVELGFRDLPDRVVAGMPSATTVAIGDDNDPEVTVSFAEPSYSVAEGGTVTVTVELDAEPERTVVIPITRTPQNGASSGDYSAPASVTFNATETSKTITFRALDDTLDDDGESVKLSFGSSLPPSVAAGSTPTTTVAIGDDDDPEVRVSFAQSRYSVAEGGDVTVTVELDADPERTVVIPISRTHKDGAVDEDYSGVPASVTFNETETRKTFSFAATQDTLDDDDERVELSFGALPERVFAGTPSATTLEIDDDDDPEVTVSFALSSYRVGEGSSVTVTVELDADPERTVVIPITRTHQNGATGSDYSGVPASVTFNATETRKTFSFAATQDTLDDDDERVELGFRDLPDRVVAGIPSATTVAIGDDDDPEVRVSFAQSRYSVAEGGDVTVTVELSADPERTVVIPISRTHKDGAVDEDYSGVPASVTFNETETRKTFSFAATQDTLDDDDERVELSFGALPERVFAGTPNATTLEIDDNDDPEVTVSFALSSYRVGEGGDGHGHGRAGRRSRTHGGDPDQRGQPGRRDRRRLLGRAGQRQLQRDRDIEDIPLHCHTGHGGRRRRARGAELRRPARAGLRRDAERDDVGDRRRR